MSNECVTFTYGDYLFRPAPLFSINSEPLKTPDGTGYGVIHNVTFNGTLLSTGAVETESGIAGVIQEIESLKEALDRDGKLLKIETPDNTPILSGYPKVTSFNIEPNNDNYTLRADYSIDMELINLRSGSSADLFNGNDDPTAFQLPPFIESASESWDVEILDNQYPTAFALSGNKSEVFLHRTAVTHTVNVQARLAYTGLNYSNDIFEDAKKYATGVLLKSTLDGDVLRKFVDLSGVLGGPGSYVETTGVFNHYRTVGLNKTEGTIDVTETFYLVPDSGDAGDYQLPPSNATETFDISTSLEEGIWTIGIQGDIQGYDLVDFGREFSVDITQSKFQNASGYFTYLWGGSQSVLFRRAYSALEMAKNSITECFAQGVINPIPVSTSFGLNPKAGAINYSVQWDTKPQQIVATGDSCIISQDIAIDKVKPNDVFATHTILGRAQGPLFQDIGTTTARSETINISVVCPPPTSLASEAEMYKFYPINEIEDFISTYTGFALTSYEQIFVTQNTENFNFSAGTMTRSKGFTYNNCD
jgi:hypothetical protein